ncbi:hypothetical protein BJ986_000182 [Phycicoccus badiiscoriae]|uniref:Uncharacterized protein n=1 Tax=Pedococcus badiiscoriae TaxID=642776 RepID=A0A852WHF7_9MICO|nr:hypothetical protein [Pedococcus badiiscoriae]
MPCRDLARGWQEAFVARRRAGSGAAGDEVDEVDEVVRGLGGPRCASSWPYGPEL